MLPELDSQFMGQLIFAVCLRYVNNFDISTRDMLVFLTSVLIVYMSIGTLVAVLRTTAARPVGAATGLVRVCIKVAEAAAQVCMSLMAVTLSRISDAMPLSPHSVLLIIVTYSLAQERLRI